MQPDLISRRAKNHPILFLAEFLRHPRQVASITPSSRFVERRIVDLADIASAHTIVELGAGSGGTTRAILAAMPVHARLVAIEINPQFCDLLRRIDDARLVVHRGDAQELRDALICYELGAPDAVVSGIPFSTIDAATASSIIETIWTVLAPGGRFVAYQLRAQVERLSRRLFGAPHAEVALLNVPPLHVYRWQKQDGMQCIAADDSRGATIDASVH